MINNPVINVKSQFPTHHATDHFVSRIHRVHFDDVITEVQRLKTIFLPQQSNERTSGPVQAFAKALPVNAIQQQTLIK